MEVRECSEMQRESWSLKIVKDLMALSCMCVNPSVSPSSTPIETCSQTLSLLSYIYIQLFLQVNKEQAEKCRDIGVVALRQGDTEKAKKFLSKSLQLYPLPGVEALLSQANSSSSTTENRPNHESSSTAAGNSSSNNSNGASNASSTRPAAAASSTTRTGECGREYTTEQVKIVERVLTAKQGGRGAHYRVLNISESATEAQIKTAYRKLSLKVHPDKNAAPQASEAFKAVGLAYATLSDTQKRHIYDRYGEGTCFCSVTRVSMFELHD
jgi:DnaJ family protein B protein 12